MIVDKSEFTKIALDLRFHTATLENLQGQIFDDSYRKGSLMIFRAMVMKKELETNFEEEKFYEFESKVDEISDYIQDIIKSPTIFGTFFQ
ncbi:MAG: hypothetical protein RSB05_06465 [Clostridiales bacterium]